MIKLKNIVIILSLLLFIGFSGNDVKSKEYYRTFEIIGISGKTLTLQDSDGNVIQAEKDPGHNYMVGYKVRYDSVRKRLRGYRWQDYEVIAISDDSITLKHKSGDILKVAGNFTRDYKVGEQVRYDSVGKKLQPVDEDAGQWKQYTVVAESSDNITLRATDGSKIIVYVNNNLYLEQRRVYLPRYKVGDLVRYNAATNKLRKGVIRTYDWQDYEVKKVNANQIVLINKDKGELILQNDYGYELQPGDKVKYDRLNDRLKKTR